MDMNPIDIPAIPAQNTMGGSLKNAGGSEEQKLKKAAQSFEGFFISMLFEKMQKTAGGKGMFGKGTSGEVYGQLFNQALGDKLAAQQGIGLSKMLMENLYKKNETHANFPKPFSPIDR